MSKKVILPYIIYLGIFFPLFFGNLVIFNGQYINVIDIFSSYSFNASILLFFLPFITLLTAIILFPKYSKNRNFIGVFALLFFLSSALCLCNPIIFSFISGCKYQQVGYGYSTIIFFIINVLLCLYFFRLSVSALTFKIREIVEIAILIGMAVVLDMKFCKIPMAANGGSISFAMVPLLIISLRFGIGKALLANGLVFGLITCLLDGYGIVTFPFDYLLGFGSLATLSLFSKLIFKDKKYTWKMVLFLFLGILVCFALRTMAATLSGIIIYRLDFVSSLIYQMLYLPASFGACFGVLLILYKPLVYINKRFPILKSE